MAISVTGSDVDGDSLTFGVVTQPTNGALSGTTPNLTYTPDPNFNGSDSFTFKANDGFLDSATATVSVTVNSINDDPVADAQSVTANEDASLAISLTGSDVDGDSLTFGVVTQPTNGTLSGVAPNLTYAPNTGFVGTDNFTYQVSDGMGGADTATVSINVQSSSPPQTIVLDVVDGWDKKNEKTLVADGKTYTIQASDDEWWGIEAAFFTSYGFQTTVPDGATIQSVNIYIEHWEEVELSAGSIQ